MSDIFPTTHFLKSASSGHKKLASLLNLVPAKKALVELPSLELPFKKFAGGKIPVTLLLLGEDVRRRWEKPSC